MANKERITKRLIKKAIHGSYGEINQIALKAGCNPRTVKRKLDQYPDLQKLIEDEKAILRITQKELAMNTILEALTKKPEETERDKDRRVKVALWAAERLGVEEGYNPTLEIKGGVGDTNLTLNFIDKEGSKFTQTE